MIRPVEGVTIRRPPETACRQDPTSHAGRTHGAGATNTAACMEHLWNVMKKGLLAGDTLR